HGSIDDALDSNGNLRFGARGRLAHEAVPSIVAQHILGGSLRSSDIAIRDPCRIILPRIAATVRSLLRPDWGGAVIAFTAHRRSNLLYSASLPLRALRPPSSGDRVGRRDRMSSTTRRRRSAPSTASSADWPRPVHEVSPCSSS